MTGYSRILTVSTLGAVMAASPQAGAVEFLGGDLSANIGVVSNYYFRGVTQTDDGAAVQGGLDWGHDIGIYLGTWASNVDFDGEETVVNVDGDTVRVKGRNNTSYELDLYGGWDFDHWLPENFRLGLNTIYYAYPDSGPDIDYYEVGGSAGWRWISAGVQYTVWGDADDGPFQDGDVYYYGQLDIPLPKGFSIGGLFGRYNFDDADDYNHWGISLSKDAGKFGTFSANYEQTNGDDGDAVADDDDPKGWVGWNVTFE